jgi:hypothetical protein
LGLIVEPTVFVGGEIVMLQILPGNQLLAMEGAAQGDEDKATISAGKFADPPGFAVSPKPAGR